MLCVDMHGPMCLICFQLNWCGFRLIIALIHVFIYLFLGLILNFKINVSPVFGIDVKIIIYFINNIKNKLFIRIDSKF